MNEGEAALDCLFLIGIRADGEGFLEEEFCAVIILPLKQEISEIPQGGVKVPVHINCLFKIPANLLNVRPGCLFKGKGAIIIILRIAHGSRARGGRGG